MRILGSRTNPINHKDRKMMKRIIFGLSLIFTLSILFTTTSCSRKSGCITAENAQVKTNRKGELPTRRGKSSLFPKQMRKKKRGK